MSSIRPDPNLLKKYPNAITQEDIDRRHRFTAVLQGLAIGEALGTAVDYLTADHIAERYPDGVRKIEGGGPFERAPGRPGAHVQLALAVAESLAQNGGSLSMDDVCRRLVEWLESAPRDVSPITRAAIQNLRAGDPPDQSGAVAWEDLGRRQAHDNGGLCLVVPVALSTLSPTDRLAEDAARLSKATHYDPKCVGGAVAVVTAIAGLVRSEEDAFERAALAAAPYDVEVRTTIERAQARPPAGLRVDGPERSAVLTTIEIAFSALAHATSFEEGLVDVLARGGDTDANAAVTGALLAARFGRQQLPEAWLKATHATGRLGALSETLYKAAGGK